MIIRLILSSWFTKMALFKYFIGEIQKDWRSNSMILLYLSFYYKSNKKVLFKYYLTDSDYCLGRHPLSKEGKPLRNIRNRVQPNFSLRTVATRRHLCFSVFFYKKEVLFNYLKGLFWNVGKPTDAPGNNYHDLCLRSSTHISPLSSGSFISI